MNRRVAVDGGRSSCPGQWYLLRRQRDVTDRELALWLRSSWGPSVEQRLPERGDTRSKRERRNSFLSSCAFACRCSLSKHMVRRGSPLKVPASTNSRFISYQKLTSQIVPMYVRIYTTRGYTVCTGWKEKFAKAAKLNFKVKKSFFFCIVLYSSRR